MLKLKRSFRVVALIVALCLPATQAFGQFGMFGGGMFGGGMFGGMMGGGMFGGMMGGGMFGGMMGGGMMGGGMMGGGGAGVEINPDGVLRDVSRDPTGKLTRDRYLAAKKDAAEYSRSEYRKVSLNRLEAAIKKRIEKKEPITDDMAFLAGLTRIKYVMYLPESNDIILAGPAEPAFMDVDGEVRGIDSTRPCIHLSDVVAAMRAYPPGGRYTFSIGCSIDPTKEGLERMQRYIASIGGRPPRPEVIVAGLKAAMGKQNITVHGVSPKTHFAQTLVAADYRMKLISIGVEKPPVKISSYVDLSRGGSASTMARFYFTPNYEMVVMADDHLAMELVGDGVKLVGADEVVTASGERLSSKSGDAASKRFTAGFTEKYPELAEKVPVYAQLRNLVDITVAAAYLQKEDLYGRGGHTFELFMDEDKFHIETLTAPKQVDTVVTAVWKGSRLVTPMGGGVHLEPRQALDTQNLLPDEGGKMAERRKALKADSLTDDRWWWD